MIVYIFIYIYIYIYTHIFFYVRKNNITPEEGLMHPALNSSVPSLPPCQNGALLLFPAVQATRRPDGQGLQAPWTSNQRNVMGGGEESTQCHNT